jgi:hypothetical protein
MNEPFLFLYLVFLLVQIDLYEGLRSFITAFLLDLLWDKGFLLEMKQFPFLGIWSRPLRGYHSDY